MSEGVAKVKQAIIDSPYGLDYAKKALVWLVGESEGFTGNVCLANAPIVIALTAHDTNSDSGQTRLRDLMGELGIKQKFTYHCGCYRDKGFDAGSKLGCVWLSTELYDHNARCFMYSDVEAQILETRLVAL